MQVLLVLFLVLVMGDGFPNDDDEPVTYSANRVVGDIHPQGAATPAQRFIDTTVGAGLFTTNSDPNVVAVDPLTGEDAPAGTDVGFGSAVRRFIQTGVLNGDFSIPPPDTSQAISDSNVLPYWTWTPDANHYALLEADTDYASGQSFHILTNGLGTSYLTQWVAVPRSQGQQYRVLLSSFAEDLWGAASLMYRFYQSDATTTVGSEVTTSMSNGAETKVDAGLVPALASYVRIRIRFANSVDSGMVIGEVRAAFLPAEASLGLKSSTAASGNIANTETQVTGITIPAGTFTAGSTYRITAYGTASNSSGANRTLTLRVRVGTTTLSGNIAGNIAPNILDTASGDGFKVTFLVTIRTAGGSGTVIANGEYLSSAMPLNALVGVTEETASVAVDTTVSNVLELTAETGNASASVNVRQALIECVMAS